MSARQSQAIGILSPATRASSKHDGLAPLEASTAGGIRAVLVHIDDPRLRIGGSINALRKNRLAVAASRKAVSRKSMAWTIEATARYSRSVHVRLLFIEAEAWLQNADGGKV